VSRRILVVTTAPVEGGALRDRVLEHAGNGETELKVVATASDLSPLDWLANDEDDARAEAESRAVEVGQAVAPEADHVEAEVGDTDPVQAIEDALRTFQADELVLVTRKADDAGWLEEGTASEALARFNLPVTHLVVDED
jgi:Universal stress protein family